MPCEKCRSKAMKIAVTKYGVTKVEIQGKEKNELVVIGNDEVDSVKLARSLRKKLHYAKILSVQEEKKEEKKDEKKDEKNEIPIPYTYTCYPNHMNPSVVYDDSNPSFCSIM
ncbi:hypothetical protein LWI28_026627 [Acer negundo]|uniref:HMA domain-containing protein n=1 Tax=Acer negundo TaxID=4023 RepID=A0AAD5NZA9_ACENE|nr:hypothetical protein LWI28_026627 [Acer negundo]